MVCTSFSKKLCSNSDCRVCDDRRIPKDLIEKYWIHDMNTKDPYSVTRGSSFKYWFRCRNDLCNHVGLVRASKFMTSTYCIYCRGGTLCGECDKCYNRSLESETIGAYWMSQYNGDADPKLICKKSDSNIYYFSCRNCRHLYRTTPYLFTQNTYCKFCTPMGGEVCKRLACEVCLPNRFSSHPMSDHWDYEENHPVRPEQIRLQSGQTYSFKCYECDVKYTSLISNVANGHWCNCINNKTERIVLDWLTEIGLNYKGQYILESIPNRKFDCCIEKCYLILEIDGNQHFKDIPSWNSICDNIREIDILKMIHTIVRISQMDIWNNTIDWRAMLLPYLKIHDTPTVHYISSDPSIYDRHRADMTRSLTVI
jgi:very-short-patch-repair endonuclease